MHLTPTQISIVYSTMRAKAPYLYKLCHMANSPELPLKRISLMLAHSDIKGVLIAYKDANNVVRYCPLLIDKIQLKKERLSQHIKDSALSADATELFKKREGSDQGIIVYVSSAKDDDPEQYELALHNIYCSAEDVKKVYGDIGSYPQFTECQVPKDL